MVFPKFRVWDKTKKVMHEVDYISFVDNKVYVTFNDGEELYIPIQEVALMQSTGLKDKNGVEIYEDDIVNVVYKQGCSDFNDGLMGAVCGSDELYSWYIGGQVQDDLHIIDQRYYIEVIGNLHELSS